VLLVSLLIALTGGSACGSPLLPGRLEGGVLATFEVGSERFKVFVTNSATIDQLFELKNGTSLANIPNARIQRGSGQGRHNAPYSWHLDPQEIEMAFAAIEVCDGAPSYVQDHRDEYVNVVKRYCPWGARLVELQDFR
jgi:hypothetical protein